MNTKHDMGLDILKTLRSITRRIKRHSTTTWRSGGLTIPQNLCLTAVSALNEKGEATVGTVSEEVRLASATVSRILDRLERAGLVARERRTNTDRRKVFLALTPEGKRRLRDLPVPLDETFLKRLAGLSARERRELQEALEGVAKLMEPEAAAAKLAS